MMLSIQRKISLDNSSNDEYIEKQKAPSTIFKSQLIIRGGASPPNRENPPSPPFVKGRCEKFGIYPLTLPSPAGGEDKHIEIRKKFPPP